MAEIQAVNAKVEGSVDCIARLVEAINLWSYRYRLETLVD
jgi:hypothetical protein